MAALMPEASRPFSLTASIKSNVKSDIALGKYKKYAAFCLLTSAPVVFPASTLQSVSARGI
jgi:hypothetical protein